MSGFLIDPKIPFKAILIGIGVAVGVTLLMTCAVCGVMTLTSGIPYAAAPYILLIAGSVGIFCGAYCCTAINKSRGMILGLVCGALVFIIFFVASLSTGETITLVTLLRLIVLLIGGMLGGIKGVNKSEKLHIK